MLPAFLDMKDRDTPCASVDQVDYFIEVSSERVDVLAIEWSHKRPIDAVDRIVSEVISFVLERFNLGNVLVDLPRILQHLVKERGRARHPAGYLREEVVKLIVSRD
jgi:hypothetical protein